jgi:hypothetical protein
MKELLEFGEMPSTVVQGYAARSPQTSLLRTVLYPLCAITLKIVFCLLYSTD